MNNNLNYNINKYQIITNAGMSVLQILVNALSMFFSYRIILISIGVDQLGIWSLVLASTSFYSLANFGLAGSVIKFVATYVARSDHENASKVIQTASITMVVFLITVLLISYPLIQIILNRLIPKGFVPLAIKVLPFAAASMILMLLSGVFQASLDGCGRVDLRNLLMIAGTLFHLLLVFIFVPRYGLNGAAYAKVMQNGFLLVGSFSLARFMMPFLPRVLFRWNKTTFREIIGYGSAFQLISICYLLFDPVTKGLLTRFGSLTLVGYYEMANRLIYQSYTFFVSTNQTLVPAIAFLKEKAINKMTSVYHLSYRLVLYLSLSAFTILLAYLPIISDLWIGRIEHSFILYGTLLGIGYLSNTLISPSYTAYMGLGNLKWNLTGRVTTALLNLIFGYIFGVIYGGIGVVIGWTFALLIGSMIIIISYHLHYNVAINTLLQKESLGLLLIFGFIILNNIFFIINNKNAYYNTIFISSIAVICPIIVIVLMWYHPMRKHINNMIKIKY